MENCCFPIYSFLIGDKMIASDKFKPIVVDMLTKEGMSVDDVRTYLEDIISDFENGEFD